MKNKKIRKLINQINKNHNYHNFIISLRYIVMFINKYNYLNLFNFSINKIFFRSILISFLITCSI